MADLMAFLPFGSSMFILSILDESICFITCGCATHTTWSLQYLAGDTGLAPLQGRMSYPALGPCDRMPWDHPQGLGAALALATAAPCRTALLWGLSLAAPRQTLRSDGVVMGSAEREIFFSHSLENLW